MPFPAPLASLLKKFVIFFLVVIFSYHNLEISKKKYFWLDEAYESTVTCGESTSATLKHGAVGQCSPNPLYYVLQKELTSPLIRHGFNQSALWKYRLISLLSSTGALVGIAIGLWYLFGFSGSLFGLLAIGNSGFFQIYSAENRPYLLWLFLFTISFLWTSHLATRSKKMNSLQKSFILIVSSFLTLVSGGGGVQSLGFLFVLLIQKLRKWKFLLTTGVFVVVITYYYSQFSCHYSTAGELDLLNTHDWNLLKNIIKLIWMDPLKPIGFVFNVCFLGALLIPFSRKLFKNNNALETQTRINIQTHHLNLLVQLLAAIGIGVLVAIRHYYFIQRIFIFLLVLKAMGAGLGAYLFHLLISPQLSKIDWKLNTSVFTVLSIVFTSSTLIAAKKQQHITIEQSRKAPVLNPSQHFVCSDLAETNWLYFPQENAPEVSINQALAFSSFLNSCGIKHSSSATQAGNVLISGDGRFQVFSSSIPSPYNAVPFQQFGMMVPVISDDNS